MESFAAGVHLDTFGGPDYASVLTVRFFDVFRG